MTKFAANENAVVEIPLADVMPDVNNPRRVKPSPEKIAERAESIKARGLLNPIRIYPDGTIEDGECRFQASRVLKAKTIRAIVVERPDSEAETLERQLVANLSRDDMAPLDVADAFRRLRDDLGRTPAEIAEETGWSLARIDRYLSAADLPPEGRDAFAAGKIGLEVASAIMTGFDDRHRQKAIELAAKRPTAAKALDALAVYAKDIAMPEADRTAALSAKEKKELRKGVTRVKKLAEDLAGKGAELVCAHKGRLEDLAAAAKAMKALAAEIESAVGKAQAKAELSRAEPAPIETEVPKEPKSRRKVEAPAKTGTDG